MSIELSNHIESIAFIMFKMRLLYIFFLIKFDFSFENQKLIWIEKNKQVIEYKDIIDNCLYKFWIKFPQFWNKIYLLYMIFLIWFLSIE